MQNCQVMIQDVEHSRRIVSRAREEKDLPEFLSVLCRSYIYWPSSKDEEFALPNHMQKYLDAFTSSYEAFKASRTLQWRLSQGTVNVELEFLDGRKVDQSVSPILASIIWLFEEKGNR
eukprot:TRINITY_DN5845_c0_g1_i7.p1 TRINITY_DN5845_c0_g1~~TRINITY_DN5845_c0_g1_i7.p1  ORF type:complete len:118 (-),score=19.06 TRINITY_DN5845_c0_g1_i7:265-618(-)